MKHDNNVIDLQSKKAKESNKFANLSLDIYDTPEEYKIHLQLLAKDLAKNNKIQHLEQMKRKEREEEDEWKPRLKRSTSNPFLYFNERREDIMEVQTLENKPEEKMRLEQTAIYGQGIRI